MAYEPIIENAQGMVDLIIKSGSRVNKGDLIGYSSGWVRADIDVGVAIYAQYIAMDPMTGDGARTIKACRACTLTDADAPYTANTAQYASGTVGEHTEDRPTTDGDVVQVVGRSLSTKIVLLDIKQPKEFEMFLSPDPYDTTGEPGLGKADTGWVGPEVNGTEEVYFKGRLPAGLIGSVAAARMIMNSINSTSGDVDLSIVGAYDGASGSGQAANDQDTGPATIEEQDWVQTDANDKILWVDVSGLLDVGMYTPGRNFCILADWDVLTSGATQIGLYIRGWTV